MARDRGSDDVAALAHRLRHNPVVVEQVLGNGRTHQVDQALSDLAHHAGVPVYVALVPRPDGLANDDPAEDLVIRLHARVGQPGAYLVGVPGTCSGTARSRTTWPPPARRRWRSAPWTAPHSASRRSCVSPTTRDGSRPGRR